MSRLRSIDSCRLIDILDLRDIVSALALSFDLIGETVDNIAVNVGTARDHVHVSKQIIVARSPHKVTTASITFAFIFHKEWDGCDHQSSRISIRCSQGRNLACLSSFLCPTSLAH